MHSNVSYDGTLELLRTHYQLSMVAERFCYISIPRTWKKKKKKRQCTDNTDFPISVTRNKQNPTNSQSKRQLNTTERKK